MNIHQVLQAGGGDEYTPSPVAGGEENFYRIKSPLDWRLVVVQLVEEEGTTRTLKHSQPLPYLCRGGEELAKRVKIRLLQNRLQSSLSLSPHREEITVLFIYRA